LLEAIEGYENGTTDHACTAKGGVNKTVKHSRFRDHPNAVERECVHLRESGCKFTAGIWVLIDTWNTFWNY